MEWQIWFILIIATAVILLAMGVPVFAALGITSFIFLSINASLGVALSSVATQTWGFWSNYGLLALPLFMVMGEFMFKSGAVSDIYDFTSKWLQNIRGGLAMVAVGVGAIFGALSGSSVAAVAALGKIQADEMFKRGYDKSLACGSILGGASLAHLIPPSGMAVFYASFVGISIGQQLFAGFIPGVLLGALTAIYIFIYVKIQPSKAPLEPPVSWKEKFLSLKRLIVPAMLAIFVLGSIYTGIATVIEAAGFGALASILVAAISRKVNFQDSLKMLMNAVQSTGFIMLIGAGGALLSFTLNFYMIPQYLADVLVGLHLSRYLLMAIIMVAYILLGCFLDAVSLVVVTLPILMPLIIAMDFSLMWFGVALLMTVEIGTYTPPVGFSLYILKGIVGDRATLLEIFKGAVTVGSIPNLIMIVLLILFPMIVDWLPNMMTN